MINDAIMTVCIWLMIMALFAIAGIAIAAIV